MTRSQRPVKRWSRPDNAGSRRWRRCSRRRRRRTGNGSLPSGRRGTPLPAAAVKRQYRSRAAKESCRQVPLRGRGGEVHSGAVSVFAVWWRKLLLALHLTRIKINLAISIPSRTEEEESVLIPSSSIALRLEDSVGESSPLSIPRKSSPKYTGIIRRIASCLELEEAYIKRAYTPLLSLLPPPSCTGKNWILCPNGLFTGADPSPPRSFDSRRFRGEGIVGMFETRDNKERKKERKGTREEGEIYIYLICKKFINLLVYEDEKTNKKEILNHFEMTDRGIFRESCTRG